jgi:hypothetical protein
LCRDPTLRKTIAVGSFAADQFSRSSMARTLGFLFLLVGVIALLVGFINGHMMMGSFPHPSNGSAEYVFFGPFSAVSALGIFGGTTATCYGLAMIWVTRSRKS